MPCEVDWMQSGGGLEQPERYLTDGPVWRAAQYLACHLADQFIRIGTLGCGPLSLRLLTFRCGYRYS